MRTLFGIIIFVCSIPGIWMAADEFRAAKRAKEPGFARAHWMLGALICGGVVAIDAIGAGIMMR